MKHLFKGIAAGALMMASTAHAAADEVMFMDLRVSSAGERAALFNVFRNERTVMMRGPLGPYDTISVFCEDITHDFNDSVKQIEGMITALYTAEEYVGVKKSIEDAVTKAKEHCVLNIS